MRLAHAVPHAVAADPDPASVEALIRGLIANGHAGHVVPCLRARSANDVALSCAYENLARAASARGQVESLYALGLARLPRLTTPTAPAILSDLEGILASSEVGSAVHVADNAFRDDVLRWISDTGGRVSEFITRQPDLPGFNALVRRGVVKSFSLPDGTAIVSKGMNADKPGRLRTELLNCREVAKRLKLDCVMEPRALARAALGRPIMLGVVQPFAVVRDGSDGSYYALSIYLALPTLEHLLLTETNPLVRHDYLSHTRVILDALFDSGVLWNDMAPRNILVDDSTTAIAYHILDFEKTVTLQSSATAVERAWHCRGPVGVEEFGALCTRQELETIFGGYFDPEGWETGSREPVPFPLRREVADVLGRRQCNVTLGSYNMCDREILAVRVPYTDSHGRKHYPAHLNFKIDHYCGAEYDCKTTEILIAARRHGTFGVVVQLIAAMVDNLEETIVVFDWGLSKTQRSVEANRARAMARLQRGLDELYSGRGARRGFRRTAADLKRRVGGRQRR